MFLHCCSLNIINYVLYKLCSLFFIIFFLSNIIMLKWRDNTHTHTHTAFVIQMFRTFQLTMVRNLIIFVRSFLYCFRNCNWLFSCSKYRRTGNADDIENISLCRSSVHEYHTGSTEVTKSLCRCSQFARFFNIEN